MTLPGPQGPESELRQPESAARCPQDTGVDPPPGNTQGCRLSAVRKGQTLCFSLGLAVVFSAQSVRAVLCVSLSHTYMHTHTHTRTHARAHTRTGITCSHFYEKAQCKFSPHCYCYLIYFWTSPLRIPGSENISKLNV